MKPSARTTPDLLHLASAARTANNATLAALVSAELRVRHDAYQPMSWLRDQYSGYCDTCRTAWWLGDVPREICPFCGNLTTPF